MRSLIKKHWRAWVGPLGDWFTSGYSRGAEIPEFKAGFMSSVLVQEPKSSAEDVLKKLLERPEWRTVETIVRWPDDLVSFADLFAHPNFQNVRELKQPLYEQRLLLLGQADGKHLEAIEVGSATATRRRPARRASSTRCTSRPTSSSRACVRSVPPETVVEVGANDAGVDGTAKSLARIEKFIRAL